jgi:cell fate regulator YaaT (PSP1 superfamily)
MVKVVGVRFKKAGKVYYFNPVNFDIHKGDFIIVETARGIEFGESVSDIKEITDDDIISPLKDVIRIASTEDIKRHNENLERQKEAFLLCTDKIAQHQLVMKLIDVEYTFDNNKVIFYFTADGRVDFRELVKDLAAIFRTRIELRQIGVRDEAKMIGGIGPCGRTMCCSSFLGDFAPVSIKMAKEQNLSLNPTKISGICGRLMCCLNYEEETYEFIRQSLPRVSSIVDTEFGRGEVVGNSVVKEMVKVKTKNSEGDEIIKEIPMSEVKLISGSFEGTVVDEEIKIEAIGKEIGEDVDPSVIKELIKEN